jgi:membrane protein implicated in regulation of membrane protease activity
MLILVTILTMASLLSAGFQAILFRFHGAAQTVVGLILVPFAFLSVVMIANLAGKLIDKYEEKKVENIINQMEDDDVERITRVLEKRRARRDGEITGP